MAPPISKNSSGPKGKAMQLVGFAPIGSMVTSLSPFVAKLETMLRLANLPYEGLLGNPSSKKVAPKGKLPVLRNGSDVVADSSCIVEYLEAKFPTEMELFIPKDPCKAAQAMAMQRMLEEHTYFLYMNELWLRDSLSSVYLPRMMGTMGLSWPLRSLVQVLLRREMRRNLHGQGVERLTETEVCERMAKDLNVVEQCLVEGPYLTGTTPTAADCFLFGLLDLIRGALDGSKEKDRLWSAVESHPRLIAFYERVKKQAFPEGRSPHWQHEYHG